MILEQYLRQIQEVRRKPSKKKPRRLKKGKGKEISIEDAYRMLEAKARKASIAKFIPSKKPSNPISSWLYGHSVGLPGETFTDIKGTPLFPLIQINCSELPFVPPQLKGTALVVVYVSAGGWPQWNMPIAKKIAPGKYAGINWQIREYKSLNNLKIVEGLRVPKSWNDSTEWFAKSSAIKWKLATNEFPGWEDAWYVLGEDVMSAINSTPADKFYDEYLNSAETKVGGYLYEVQGYPPPHKMADYVFQIGQNMKVDMQIGDNGVMSFFKGTNHWECNIDSY